MTSEARNRFIATLNEPLKALQLRDPANIAAAVVGFAEGVLLDRARGKASARANAVA